MSVCDHYHYQVDNIKCHSPKRYLRIYSFASCVALTPSSTMYEYGGAWGKMRSRNLFIKFSHFRSEVVNTDLDYFGKHSRICKYSKHKGAGTHTHAAVYAPLFGRNAYICTVHKRQVNCFDRKMGFSFFLFSGIVVRVLLCVRLVKCRNF